MAKLKIDDLEVNGLLTIERSKAYNEDGTSYAKTVAILQTHLYFEDISRIESARYTLTDIDVVKENFGSDDYNIIYTMTGTLKIKGFSSPELPDVKFIVDYDTMMKYENKIYKDQDDVFGLFKEDVHE